MDIASEDEKGAYSDCKEMFDDAKEELKRAIDEVGENDAKVLSTKAAEINNWLSAVMGYQQTCIDGIPEGKMKQDFDKLFKESRELVSNCLAVMAQFASFFSIFEGAGNIHLPWETDNNDAPAPASGSSASAPGVAPAGSALAPGSAPRPAPVPVPSIDDPLPTLPIPTWAGPSEFKGSNEKPTPNVTVAQDGSGDFKTISEALAAIQTPYEGRYTSLFSFDYFKEIFVICGLDSHHAKHSLLMHGRYVVYVKAGIYDETVTVTKKLTNLTMYGDGGDKSIITGNKNFVDGVRTFQTASFGKRKLENPWIS